MFVVTLATVVWCVGCKVEWQRSLEQQKQAEAEKNAHIAVKTAVVASPVPSTDNAAQVIAACGPAASDQVITVNENNVSGTVRRMVYRSPRETTLDFIPLQTNENSGSGHSTAASNTVWRFNVALVDNQKLLTADNIKVYMPCAARALAKEF